MGSINRAEARMLPHEYAPECRQSVALLLEAGLFIVFGEYSDVDEVGFSNNYVAYGFPDFKVSFPGRADQYGRDEMDQGAA